jgi:hypothetical protein
MINGAVRDVNSDLLVLIAASKQQEGDRVTGCTNSAG